MNTRIAILVATMLSVTWESHLLGEHEVGNCVAPTGIFGSCERYLTFKGSQDGIDYLTDVSCPACVRTAVDDEYPGVFHFTCPKKKGNYSACCLAFGWERREKTGC